MVRRCTTCKAAPIGAVIVLNDVTDFRRLEHIRRDFVANVSHELKTPITSIKGFVETLLDGAMNDPVDSRALSANRRQAGRSAARHHRRSAEPFENRAERRRATTSPWSRAVRRCSKSRSTPASRPRPRRNLAQARMRRTAKPRESIRCCSNKPSSICWTMPSNTASRAARSVFGPPPMTAK